MICSYCNCKDVENGVYYPYSMGEIGSEQELEEQPSGYDCPECGQFNKM